MRNTPKMVVRMIIRPGRKPSEGVRQPPSWRSGPTGPLGPLEPPAVRCSLGAGSRQVRREVDATHGNVSSANI